ncbi:hypothetical protein ABPG72_013352, partial [Tetrahymena utriculariae]
MNSASETITMQMYSMAALIMLTISDYLKKEKLMNFNDFTKHPPKNSSMCLQSELHHLIQLRCKEPILCNHQQLEKHKRQILLTNYSPQKSMNIPTWHQIERNFEIFYIHIIEGGPNKLYKQYKMMIHKSQRLGKEGLEKKNV